MPVNAISLYPMKPGTNINRYLKVDTYDHIRAAAFLVDKGLNNIVTMVRKARCG